MKIRYVLMTLIISAVLISCSKEKTKCEKWEYHDDCIPKNASVVCNDTPPGSKPTTSVCGDDLMGLTPGTKRVIADNADRKIERIYVKKID